MLEYGTLWAWFSMKKFIWSYLYQSCSWYKLWKRGWHLWQQPPCKPANDRHSLKHNQIIRSQIDIYVWDVQSENFQITRRIPCAPLLTFSILKEWVSLKGFRMMSCHGKMVRTRKARLVPSFQHKPQIWLVKYHHRNPKCIVQSYGKTVWMSWNLGEKHLFAPNLKIQSQISFKALLFGYHVEDFGLENNDLDTENSYLVHTLKLFARGKSNLQLLICHQSKIWKDQRRQNKSIQGEYNASFFMGPILHLLHWSIGAERVLSM